MSKKDKKDPENDKKIGKNGVDLGERGVYDKRNKLNELTGKEWLYFTNSVWVTGYSPTAIESVGLKHRKIHPSPKPPGLLKDIIEFFTKSDGKILDPFVGVGGTLLGAALAGGKRQAFGIDLEEKYKEAYELACEEEGLKKMDFIVSDAEHALKSDKRLKDEEFDLIVADPPYSDMMSRKRTGQKVKLYNEKEATPYSDKETDLGNMDKGSFLENLKNLISLSIKKLKKDKYFVVFCKDFQPQDDNPNILHADVIYKLNEIDNLQYKGMRIWHDQAMSLYPFGYPFAFVMNQIHQYILIFRKV